MSRETCDRAKTAHTYLTYLTLAPQASTRRHRALRQAALIGPPNERLNLIHTAGAETPTFYAVDALDFIMDAGDTGDT
jgi:hypothetical protein